ncbi:GAF domain-containing protein [Deinococcus yavapaiensis]|uniref:histidine kinase n=1 Tax=Deinococcus yavapaiensis KR-236 TaxID=694435 RepID=A0A318S290_9DEIO|nr:GAF domain-containing protein [Deinococcus yavapaiensis]PYE49401.1 PAS domain S-box-containing protein [Deinococcus yavapaiensis KR-236]
MALALLEGLLDPVIAFDREWHYTYVNPRAAALAGVTPDELLGKVLWDVFPEARDTPLYGEYLHVMHAREPREFETFLPSLGIWEEVRMFPIEDGMAVHFRDITARKTSETRRERLAALTRAVSNAPDERAVALAALDVVLPALGATRGAVLREVTGNDVLEVVGATEGAAPDAWTRLAAPMRAWRERLLVYERGDDSGDVAALPLLSGEVASGVLVWRSNRNASLSPSDETFAAELAASLAQALERARLADAERRHTSRQQFLARAGELLAASLDVEATLATLTRLAVPEFGDWCGVYLPSGDVLRAVAVSHVDPDKADMLREALDFEPISLDTLGGAAEVLRTGRPLVLPTVTDALIDALGRSPQHTAMLHALGLRSYIGVPMMAHGHAVGVLALASTETARRYGEEDVAFALDLARRAGLALDHARLFEEAQQWNATLERTVEARTNELTARTRALDAFAVLTRDLAVETDVTRLVERAQDILGTLLPEGLIGYFEVRGERWMPLAVKGVMPDAAFEAALRQGLRRGAAPSFDTPFDTCEPLYLDHFTPNPQHFPPESLARLHSLASLPIRVDAEPLGVLVVALYREHGWGRADKVLLETAVGQLQLALQRARAVHVLAGRTTELEDLNRELEAFSYTISHDLRAPVRHIASFAALLRRALGEDLTERAARPLGVIESSAARMNDMIEALLSFARSSRRPLHVTRVDLGEILEAAKADLAPDFADRDVEWRVSPLPMVWGDELLLRQVLVNLLGNAVKYSSNEPRSIVTVTCDRAPREFVISVGDNGVGFDEKYADKLFGVFQRLHRAEDFEGTGIGLATVRRLVTKHGGRVWASSRLGHGAIFSFSLPTRRSDLEGA